MSQSYERSQFGRDSFLFLLLIGLIVIPFSPELTGRLLALLGLALVFVLVLVRQTVRIANNRIQVAQGVGIIRTEINLDDVQSVSVVDNINYWAGFGLRHLLSGEVLYRVSGKTAVKVVRKSGPNILIGTDDPQGLIRALEHQK